MFTSWDHIQFHFHIQVSIATWKSVDTAQSIVLGSRSEFQAGNDQHQNQGNEEGWNVHDWRCFWRKKNDKIHKPGTRSIALYNDYLLTCTGTGTVHLYSTGVANFAYYLP